MSDATWHIYERCDKRFQKNAPLEQEPVERAPIAQMPLSEAGG
jgi:hypothetical protein